jgi:hypothetical protein
MKMTSRSEVLSTAERLVNGDRDQAHGQPAITFGRIADLWSAHLGVTITPGDVAVMMVLFKAARLAANKQRLDTWIDVAGYAACGAEVSEAT